MSSAVNNKGLAMGQQQQDPSDEDYTRHMLDDLQLAAELGKTLLERNKELETALKQHQNVIDDQAQEIEYLTKQTVALREVSDSRLRIYEQLEVSIQDLERANHRLVLDNSAGKKHIKTLKTTIDNLEGKCEELQTTIDDLRLQIDVLKRRAQRTNNSTVASTPIKPIHLRHIESSYNEENSLRSPSPIQDDVRTPDKVKTEEKAPPPSPPPTTKDEMDGASTELSQLLTQLRETEMQASRDQRKIIELEEQLATLVQQNDALENQLIQLHHRGDDDMKSMYDELSTLEEVRKGQTCSRCLRNMDKNGDDLPEDDDSSMLEALMASSQHRSSFSMDVQDHAGNQSSPSTKQTGNLYKDLVDKYEALLEVHRQPLRNAKQRTVPTSNLSLQEELQMSGDFTAHIKDTDDDESGNGDSLKPEKMGAKPFSHTPTDFSEAETSSSGFADETSNKWTQTEDNRHGNYLCTIADGEDCKFTIYDHGSSAMQSRFRNQPEYQVLFKEIFSVLKQTNDTDLTPPPQQRFDDLITTPVKLLPNEQMDDDSQSVVSSTMSEMSLSQNEPTTIIENIIQSQNHSIPEPQSTAEGNGGKEERVLRPLVRQPLEYLSVEVRKRSSSRRKNKYAADRSDSPSVTHIIGSPKINYSNRPNSGRKKRDFRNAQQEQQQQQQPTTAAQAVDANWNGSTLQFWSSSDRRNVASPTPSQGSGRFEFKPSLASQELHRLKKLDLSYAEVVRKADNKKKNTARQRRK